MMRFTIVDPTGSLSFVAPPHALKAIAACCSQGARTSTELLAKLGFYDAELARNVRDNLPIFQEHNTPGETQWIADRLAVTPTYELPVVVLDEATRKLSLQPARLGLIVFNLLAKRIVQVQNSYANLERSDRGRVRRDGKPTSTFYSYQLPADWTIVP